MKKASGDTSTIKSILLAVTLLSVVYLLLMALVKMYVPSQYKCQIMPCEAASWETIKDLAFAHISDKGQEEWISSIDVFPTARTIFDSEELDDLDINIEYIATKKSASGQYVGRLIFFNDHTLWVRDMGMIKSTSDAPSSLFQDGLHRVKLGPREAYRVVWKYLQTSPALKNITTSFIGLELSDDQVAQGKLVWRFSFFIGKGSIDCLVDAENGSLLKGETYPDITPN